MHIYSTNLNKIKIHLGHDDVIVECAQVVDDEYAYVYVSINCRLFRILCGAGSASMVNLAGSIKVA